MPLWKEVVKGTTLMDINWIKPKPKRIEPIVEINVSGSNPDIKYKTSYGSKENKIDQDPGVDENGNFCCRIAVSYENNSYKDAINDLQILFSNNSTNELVISEVIRLKKLKKKVFSCALNFKKIMGQCDQGLLYILSSSKENSKFFGTEKSMYQSRALI